MTNLPISTNLASVSPGAKPAATDDSAAAGEQAFGAVLARQFADAAGGNTAQLTQMLAKLGDVQGKSGPALDDPQVTVAPAIPADMLATLLAQHAMVKEPAPAADTANTASPDSAAPVDPTQLAPQQAAAAMATAFPMNTNAAVTSAAPITSNAPLVNAVPGDKPVTAMSAAARTEQPLAVPPSKEQGAAVRSEFSQALQALEGRAATSLANGHPIQHGAEPLASALPAAAMANAVAAPHQAGAATGAAPLAVSTPVGQTGWDQELGQKITWIATQRDHSAELHLNPPQLGPLDVTLKISGDQATAVFASPHAAVREAIEQALPKLREILADSGIMLGNATVNDQSTRKEQEPSARPQYDNAGATGINDVSDRQSGSTTTVISRHNGMVDTFA